MKSLGKTRITKKQFLSVVEKNAIIEFERDALGASYDHFFGEALRLKLSNGITGQVPTSWSLESCR